MDAVLPRAMPVVTTARDNLARIAMNVRILRALGVNPFVKFPFRFLSFQSRSGWLRLYGRFTIRAALIH